MTGLVYAYVCVVCFTQLIYLTKAECNGGELQRYAYCSSSGEAEGTVVSCPVAGITGITIITSYTLDQQNKTEACVLDDTYGQFGADRVWVRNGCDAVFIVCGEGTAITISETKTTSLASTAAHTTSITELTTPTNGICTDGEIQSYSYCSSSEKAEGTVVSCPVAGISGITIITSFKLDQQNKTEACVPDDTYGQFGTDRVWVRNGCDAVFIVCGEGTATTISTTETSSMTPTAAHTTSTGEPTTLTNEGCNEGELQRYVYCSSSAYSYGTMVYCPVAGITLITSYTLDQQNITEACMIGDQSYYGIEFGNRVWVQNGCDAVFVVCAEGTATTTVAQMATTGDMKNGHCNNGEIQSYAYCSSSDKDYGTVVSCPVAGISGITLITSFTLDQQNKTEACVLDDTYGQFGTDRVWVRNGCDAVFMVCGEGTATTISTTEIASTASTAAHTTAVIELTTPTNSVCNSGEIQSYAYCSSSEKDYGTVVSCPVAGISGITVITSFTLDQQNKTVACVLDDTYGQFGADRVWVRNGCDAVFIVCGEGTATTITITEIASTTPTVAQTASTGGSVPTSTQSLSTPHSLTTSATTKGVLTTDSTQMTTMPPTATTMDVVTTNTAQFTTMASTGTTTTLRSVATMITAVAGIASAALPFIISH